MLPRTSRCSVHAIRRSSRLLSSTRPASTYHAKVRAFEFAISLNEILPMLKLHTAMYLWKYSKASGPHFGLNQYLTAAAMEDESQLGRSPRISVARTKAIYLPAWLIDASVIAMAEHITPRGAKPALTIVVSQSSYLPGCSSEPLSCMALGTYLEDGVAVPFSDKLRTQFGQEIHCIPFTLTPFLLFTLSRLTGETSATENFRLHLFSARANMMAAYPVLVPLYLVNFRVDTGDEVQSYTVVYQAATKWSPYIIDDYISLLARDPAVAQKPIYPIIPSPFLRGLRAMRSFANISCSINYPNSPSLTLPPVVTSGLAHNMNSLAHYRRATQIYQEMFFQSRDKATGAVTPQPIDWDDLRIRPYSPAETAQNRSWAQWDSDMQRARWFAAHAQPCSGTISTTMLNNMAQTVYDMHGDMRPEWLKQWHARPDKKNDGFT